MCNLTQYDESFLSWFRNHGWRIYRYLGKIEIWTHSGIHCPFKVTYKIIDKLERRNDIIKIYPTNNPWDEFWISSH